MDVLVVFTDKQLFYAFNKGLNPFNVALGLMK